MRTVGVANLVPDNTNLANRISEIFAKKKVETNQAAALEKVKELTAVIATGTPEEQTIARQQLAIISPQSSNALNPVIKNQQEQKALQSQKRAETIAVNALNVRDMSDLTAKRTHIAKLAQADLKEGKDISKYEELLEIQDVDELNLALTKTATDATNKGKLIESKLEAAKPHTDEAKAEADFKSGLISKEQRDSILGGSEDGEIIKSSLITDGFIVRQQKDGTFTKTKVLESAKVADSGKASAVTKIFDNGTTIQALPNGKTVVKGPDGLALNGDDRINALKQARNEEIDFQKTQAGAKAAGSAAIDQSTKSFERISEIKTSITNIDKAIELIDGGAQTGPIISKLPSIRASSVALDNVQKAMGLDVIGDTTFGALSKGELDLALSKALPTKLKPAALREWLVEKKAAQEKLATYLEDVAIFLGTPGNTVSGWLEAQQAIKGTDEIKQETTRIKFDAQGNQI